MSCAWCGGPVQRFNSRGKPYKYCTAECDKAAMAMRTLGINNPNPQCACGCGKEVARPWNRYVFGHGITKLSDDDVHAVRTLLNRGIPQAHIGKLFGVSQTTIGFIKSGSLHGGELRMQGRSVVRLNQIKANQQKWSNIQWVRKGKRELTKVRAQIREMQRSPWQSPQRASQPDKTSQI